MTSSKGVRVRAFAKINLVLRVGSVNADGYHPLETVFQSLTLHDVVVCTPTRGAFALVCDDPAVPVDERNLAWKAARALWRELGRPGEPAGCTITIGKHIPMLAGLGGGSADAAAAIVALHALWKGRLTPSGLAAVAARVGADVPYFLVGGTAIGLGRGDEVYPLEDLAWRWVVLACPAFGVSTADAYRWLDEDRAAGPLLPGALSAQLTVWGGRTLEIRNDLQRPVEGRHGEIGHLVTLLHRGGAEAAAMSGSGSTVFGLFTDESRARRAAHAAAGAGTQVTLTRTASRRWCQRALAGPSS
jgi:4-diphosphocytidyl-2-C-methyl-D-erythritol kinase